MKKQHPITTFLRDKATRPLTFKELTSAFGITREDKSVFKDVLRDLVANGEIIKTRTNSYALPSKIDIVTGRLSCHRDGYGFVSPDDGGEDIFIPARFLRENMHGDKVAVRVEPGRQYGKQEGRVVRTLERGYTRVVGRFEASRNFGYVVPDEHRINHDIYIAPSGYGKAKSGQVVVAEITAYPALHRNPEGKVVEVLGWPDDPEVEVKTILEKYQLPHEFSPGALEEARAIPQKLTAKELKGRTDLREQLTVTIDGETARDFDDAISVLMEKERTRLWVSIADVAHYIKEGSFLDLDAYERGTSVYFPDRCVPMLPEELSNGICSLNPRVERLTMTAEMLFDNYGEMLEVQLYPSVIRSRARLTYTIVRDIVEADGRSDSADLDPDIVADLLLMKKLALRLMEKRKNRGSIDFDLPEPEVVLNLQGQTEAIVKAERNIAHRIIEEFMLAANEAVARYLEDSHVPSIHRTHEPPDPEKLHEFREFILHFGYDLPMSQDRVKPGDMQRLLEQAAGKPEEKMVNEVLLRCMKQARYTMENYGHFGLASPCYTHFTSPIRRYPDLVVHRTLKSVLSGKMKEERKEKLVSVLPEIADHCSKRERVAMDAEREILELKKLQFMLDKTGEEYDGFISGVTPFGFFVELIDYFVEGLVHVSTLRNDFYHYIEKQHSLIGEHTGGAFRIGDRVRVIVNLVSLEKRQIDFSLTEDEIQANKPISGRGRGNDRENIQVNRRKKTGTTAKTAKTVKQGRNRRKR